MRNQLELSSLEAEIVRSQEQILVLMLHRAKIAKKEGFNKYKKILQLYGQVSLNLKNLIKK